MECNNEEAFKKLGEFLDVFGLSNVSEVTVYRRDSWTSERYVNIDVPKNRSFRYPNGGHIHFDDYGNVSVNGFQSSGESQT